MLTDQDLKKLDGLITVRIGEEIGQSEKRMAGVIESKINHALKRELDPVKKDISTIKKDVKTTINFFDHEYLDLRKRIEVIERHLNIGL